MELKWPWRQSRPGSDDPRPKSGAPEEKALASNWVALHGVADANWSDAGFAALSAQGFMTNPVVYRSIRMIAETAAAIPWVLYDGKVECERHPLRDLIDCPSPQVSGPAFFEALYGYLLIGGDAYVQCVRAENGGMALHLLRPDRVSVVTDENGWPTGYRYQVGSRTTHLPASDLSDDASGVRHVRLFHPLSDTNGFAPLEAARMALDIHNATSSWNKALLDNSARPSGALVYAPKDGSSLTPDQFDRLKSELEDGYLGAQKAGRPLLLEGGLDWKAMSLSPKEMDFVDAKHVAAREIALAFGVPPMLLGIPGDNTYSNYQEANRSFYRMTVLPLVGRVAREFTSWLGPEHGARMRFWYDADSVEGLAMERDLLWSRIGAADFLTVDEKREAVGYGPKYAKDRSHA